MGMTTIVARLAAALASNYNVLRLEWSKCGSDAFCETEMLVRYMAKFFGLQTPSIYLSDAFACIINKIFGKVIVDDNSAWKAPAINGIVYLLTEHFLGFWWDWVRYAGECLSHADCELDEDDVLTWIHFMKLEYCGTTFVENNQEHIHCDEEICIENVTHILPDMIDTCVIFFNELPLLFSVSVVGIIYLFSPSMKGLCRLPQAQQGGSPDAPVQPPPEGSSNGKPNGNDGSNSSEGSTDPGQPGGTGSSTSSGGSTIPGSGKPADGGVPRGGNDKSGSSKPTEPSESEAFSQCRGCKKTPSQTIMVQCPYCKTCRAATIPKPLLISCDACSVPPPPIKVPPPKDDQNNGSKPLPLSNIDQSLSLALSLQSNMSNQEIPFVTQNNISNINLLELQVHQNSLSTDTSTQEDDDDPDLSDDKLYNLYYLTAAKNTADLDQELALHKDHADLPH